METKKSLQQFESKKLNALNEVFGGQGRPVEVMPSFELDELIITVDRSTGDTISSNADEFGDPKFTGFDLA